MTDAGSGSVPWRDATNPVLPGFYPDPSVCRVDGDDGVWFYLVSSTFEYLPGIPVHRSRDLVTWELVSHAIHRSEQAELAGVGDSGGMFAPTIRHDGHRFLIVCTLVGGAPGGSGNFVVTATDPAGPWSDPVWWHDGGIDPSILVDDDGRLWAHGTRLASDPEWDQQTEVWVRELDASTLQLIGAERTVWSGAVRGAVWAEGPHLYRRDGRVLLMASEGGTEFHHAVSVARADHPQGPYTGNPANPVLTHRHLGHGSEVVNVGHTDLVNAPDGTSWALALASRPVGGVDILGRETFLVPVQWQDGWPVFAPNVGTLVPEPPRPVPTGRHDAPPRIEPLVAVRRQPSDVAAVADGGELTIPAGPGLTDPLPAYLGRRLTSVPASPSVRVLEVSDGAAAALALRYSSSAWVAIEVGRRGGVTEVVTTSCDADGEREIDRTSVAGHPVGTLRLRIRGLRASPVWEPVGGPVHELAALPLDALGAARSGGFVGVTYGLVASGTGTVRAVELVDAEG